MTLIPTINDIPILLPRHSHHEFGDPREHYHIDWRYLEGTPQQSKVVWEDGPVVYKELPIVRAVYDIDVPSVRILTRLSSRYDRLVDGLCPHKGLPHYNGKCTGHGLCSRQDGTIIKNYYIGVNEKRVLAEDKSNMVYDFYFDYDCVIHEYMVFAEDRLVGVRQLAKPYQMYSGDVLKLRAL